ncbi:MAG: hypothetical protein ABIH04_10270 [Planctomycetota bacterium]
MNERRKKSGCFHLASRRGSALVIVLSVVVLVAALMFVFIGRTGAEFRSQRFARENEQAYWEAAGQMNLAMYIINTSSYNIGGHNQVLAANADTGNPIPDTSVHAISVPGAPGWYKLEASATVGSATRTMRLMVCESDTFARFRLFSGSHKQTIAENTGGDIHVNGNLTFSGPDLVFAGNVTSTSGFNYENGADSSNVTVWGIKDGSVDAVSMPDISHLAGLAVEPYYVASTNNVSIELRGDSVRIKVAYVSDGEYPLPVNGVIYVKGDITAISGKLNGRLTIVSEKSIYITKSIRYVDASDKTAYLNGECDDKPYTPNPDYKGNSCLALIAAEDVLISSAAPDSLEINAMMLAKQGHVGIEGYTLLLDGTVFSYNHYFNKDSVRYLGAIITNERSIDRIVYGSLVVSGFAASEFVYDGRAGQNPPPYFPGFKRPQYKGWETGE